jgi:hypothetical protein
MVAALGENPVVARHGEQVRHRLKKGRDGEPVPQMLGGIPVWSPGL